MVSQKDEITWLLPQDHVDIEHRTFLHRHLLYMQRKMEQSHQRTGIKTGTKHKYLLTHLFLLNRRRDGDAFLLMVQVAEKY